MERQTVLIAAAVFVLGLGLGFYVFSPSPEQKFSQEMNVTVGADNGVADVEFDGRSFRILHDNSAEGSFFLDLDNDSGVEREIEITRDGTIHQDNFFVGIDGKTYTVRVRYTDDPSVRDDAWMTVTWIEEV